MNKYTNIKTKFALVVQWKELVTTVYDKPKEQLPMFNFSNNTTSRSTKDDKTSAIILDYDSGDITFSDWIKTHKGFYYFAYTTASNSKYKSKFRVVIPLKNWYSYKDIAIVVKDKFSNGLDGCTVDTSRRFFWPSKYDADGNLTLRYLSECKNAFDDIINIKSIVDFNEFMEAQSIDFKQAFYGSCDCSTFEHIKAYLNTPYPQIKGNGGASMNGLFSSICSCVKYHDEDTLDKLIAKAKSEHWTDKEINRIIDKATLLALEKS